MFRGVYILEGIGVSKWDTAVHGEVAPGTVDLCNRVLEMAPDMTLGRANEDHLCPPEHGHEIESIVKNLIDEKGVIGQMFRRLVAL